MISDTKLEMKNLNITASNANIFTYNTDGINVEEDDVYVHS